MWQNWLNGVGNGFFWFVSIEVEKCEKRFSFINDRFAHCTGNLTRKEDLFSGYLVGYVWSMVIHSSVELNY